MVGFYRLGRKAVRASARMPTSHNRDMGDPKVDVGHPPPALPLTIAARLFPGVMLPAGIAEIAVTLWSRIVGVNDLKWEEQARKPTREFLSLGLTRLRGH
jgi:hypothetical protein